MSSLQSTVLSLLFLGLVPSLSAAADATCYSLNGTELDSTFAPCQPASGSQHSGCCATNRSSGPSDICLNSGLCMATASNIVGTIWQSGCTDATGKDKACANMCPQASTSFDGHNPVPEWNIQPCNSGTYCCRSATDKNNCCNDIAAPKFTTTSLGALQLPTSTITASPSMNPSSPAPSALLSSSRISITNNNTTTTTTTTLEPLTCKQDKSILVGSAVGGTLGTALVALSAITLWMHKKEKRQRRLKEHYEAQFSSSWDLRNSVGVGVGVGGGSGGSALALAQSSRHGLVEVLPSEKEGGGFDGTRGDCYNRGG